MRYPIIPALFNCDGLFEPFFRPLHQDFDIEEDGTHYSVAVDVPGFKKSDIKIEFRGRELCISGEAKYKENHKRMSRVFAVADDVDIEKADAKLEDGVLRVTLPKREAEKPKILQIS